MRSGRHAIRGASSRPECIFLKITLQLILQNMTRKSNLYYFSLFNFIYLAKHDCKDYIEFATDIYTNIT